MVRGQPSGDAWAAGQRCVGGRRCVGSWAMAVGRLATARKWAAARGQPGDGGGQVGDGACGRRWRRQATMGVCEIR
jgi:hypothetical protein